MVGSEVFEEGLVVDMVVWVNDLFLLIVKGCGFECVWVLFGIELL